MFLLLVLFDYCDYDHGCFATFIIVVVASVSLTVVSIVIVLVSICVITICVMIVMIVGIRTAIRFVIMFFKFCCYVYCYDY